MRLVDCHLHLQDPRISPHLDDVLRRAEDAGVARMVCNGTSEADWPAVAQLASRHPQVVPCFGLHPWHVAGRSASWAQTLARFLGAVPSAIGEIGLDRWVEPRDEAAQEQVFREQLRLARDRGRPVMVHCLRAWGWLMDVLAQEPPPDAGMLIHAYGGPADLIGPLAAMGARFSFAGNVLGPRRAKARESLAAVPLDRLLIETDAPDMPPPAEFRAAGAGGPPNEPANLRGILRGIALVRGESEEMIAAAVWENAERLLRGQEPSSSPPAFRHDGLPLRQAFRNNQIGS